MASKPLPQFTKVSMFTQYCSLLLPIFHIWPFSAFLSYLHSYVLSFLEQNNFAPYQCFSGCSGHDYEQSLQEAQGAEDAGA
jgi:hypothetical protein